MELTHRERVLLALRHEPTDRVPIDFGGGPATHIHPTAYSRLLDVLGFEQESQVEGPRGEGQVVIPSERVMRRFDIDVRGVRLPELRRPCGQDRLEDDWGVIWAKASPAAPQLNVEGPLQQIDEPVAADLERMAWPHADPSLTVEKVREKVEQLRRDTDCAIVLNLPNGAFAQAQRLRGFTEFLEDLVINPSFASALLERVTDVLITLATAAIREAGGHADVVSFNDDLGMQTSPLVSPLLYRRLVKPHHAKFVAALRANTQATILMHSDGAIGDLLPDLIDCGVQAINPVQTSAVGMQPDRLKRDFGRDLAFWGGIDTHHVLPRGSTDDVVAEVHGRLADLGSGGGYVLTSVHNIMAEVPPENVIAMFETARGTEPKRNPEQGGAARASRVGQA